MLVLEAKEITELLDMPSCIRAVEAAFRARGEGRAAPSATLGFPLDGGSLHVKVASLNLSRPYVVAKVNANFPRNPEERKLPTIQGALVLLDATCGIPLAVMDSAPITTLRTAATTAVAASRLAHEDASTVTFVGCGAQARAHLAALCQVRFVERVFAVDHRPAAADEFRKFAITVHGVECSVASSLRRATRASEIVVTSTPSHRAILHRDDLEPGTFVAAVGADNEHKQEIDPEVLRESVIVVDDLEQCARIGDLHHAIDAGFVAKSYVRASLDEVVAGTRPGRLSDDETIVFDSTGLALEDVAAAALVYERAGEGASTPPSTAVS
jgi:ornithine cyclodeaminase/alanine dehydrogenase-like protein (mu-crystallin family)